MQWEGEDNEAVFSDSGGSARNSAETRSVITGVGVLAHCLKTRGSHVESFGIGRQASVIIHREQRIAASAGPSAWQIICGLCESLSCTADLTHNTV